MEEKYQTDFVVLVDEADYIAKNCAIKVAHHLNVTKNSLLKGVPEYFAADRIHAFTATATNELEAFWKLIPGWQADYKSEF